MTTINSKASVLAVMPEVTQGTPVAPTAVGDYMALQSDATMDPQFELLENDELKNSIGKSQPIIGSEAPTFGMSHYLKHSGTEGVAPAYNEIMKSFYGAERVRATEDNTVSGSTTTVINVDSGEGANYQKGDLLLIKDSVNNYSIRFVESVSTDALTLGFQVGTAPGTGVDLGKGISYSAANSSHQSLTVWHYLGNAGAVQMMAGGMATGFSFEATAGELINANYTIDGLGYYRNQIEITSSNEYIDFTDSSSTVAATMENKTYKDPHQLAEEMTTKMTAASVDVITVSYSDSTGKFTIASDGSVLSLLWSTGTNTANTIGDSIGFLIAADDTGSLTYDSDAAVSWASPQTPAYDSSVPIAAKNHEVMLGTQTDYACFHASVVSFDGSNTRSENGDLCAVSGKGEAAFNERSITVDVSALLDQHQVGYFKKFREGDEVRFQYTFGTKTGSNWIAGKCGAQYLSSATISSYNIDDADGLVQLNMTLTAFVNNSGDSETHQGFA